MGDDIIKMYEGSDNCQYFFNKKKNKWQKVCDVDTDNIPDEVFADIQKDIANAKLIVAQEQTLGSRRQ